MLTVSFVLLVLAVFVTLAAAACHVALLPVLRLLAGVSPAARSHALLLMAAAPWLIGTGVLVSSIADIWFGACDFGTACLWNEDPTEVSPWRAAVVLPLLATLAVLAARAIRQHFASRRALALLEAASEPGGEPGLSRVPTGLALALAGNGRIYLSRGLEERLSPEQYQAVVRHERAHLERRDGLFQVVAGILTASYLAPFRRRLLEALALANEEACDEAAVRVVGPAVVASAILAVERMASGAPPALLPGFADGFVAARVRRLVDPDEPRWNVGLLRAALLSTIVLAFLGADILYYLGMLILYPGV